MILTLKNFIVKLKLPFVILKIRTPPYFSGVIKNKMQACLHTLALKQACHSSFPPLWLCAIKYQICWAFTGSDHVNMEPQRSPTSKHCGQVVTNVYLLSFLGWWKLPRSIMRWVTSPSVKQRDSWSALLQNSHPRNTLSTKKVCMCCSDIVSICTKESMKSFERF